MTFDESNVKRDRRPTPKGSMRSNEAQPRDKDGKFGQKHGSAPSVSLSTPQDRKKERLNRRDEARLAMQFSGYDPENPSDDPVAADRYFAAEFRELEALTERDVDGAWKQAPAYIAPFMEALNLLPGVGTVTSSVSLVKYRGEQARLRRIRELRELSAEHPEYRELNLMTLSTPDGRLEMLDGRVRAWLEKHNRANPAKIQEFTRESTWRNPTPEMKRGIVLAQNAVVAARFAYLNGDPEQYEPPASNWAMVSGNRRQAERGGLVD